jgi:hypothetical protein
VEHGLLDGAENLSKTARAFGEFAEPRVEASTERLAGEDAAISP